MIGLSIKSIAHSLSCLSAKALILLMFATPVYSSAKQLADVPVPFNTQVQVVANNMTHNGNRLWLATYTSSLSLEESIDFYRSVWRDDPDSSIPGVVQTQSAEWLMISRLQDGYNTVIQLRLAEPHKSTGFMSIMAVSDMAGTDLDTTEFTGGGLNSTAALDNLKLLSSTQSTDSGRTSQLSVYASAQSIESTARQYVKHLRDQSWVLVSEQAHAQSKVVLLNRKSRHIELVISNDTTRGGSVIVVNEVQNHD